MENEKLSEEYAVMTSKVYQNVDDTRHKAELMKEVIIPKYQVFFLYKYYNAKKPYTQKRPRWFIPY